MDWYPIRYHIKVDAQTQHLTDKIATQLCAGRLASGLSLRKLAKRAGTSHSTLLAYEEGRKIPAITVYLRILEAAGFSADIVTHRRVRERDGIERGEELLAALQLAEKFLAKVPRYLDFPQFLATV